MMKLRIQYLAAVSAVLVALPACQTSVPEIVRKARAERATDVPEVVREARAERAANRVVAVLEGEISRRNLTHRDRTLLRALRTATFDPFPLSSHRIYVDHFSDVHDGKVMRVYLDYSGNESRTEEVQLSEEELKDYVTALSFEHFEVTNRRGLPRVLSEAPALNENAAIRAEPPDARNGGNAFEEE